LKDFGIYLEQTRTRSKKGVKSRNQQLDIQTLMSRNDHSLHDTQESNEDYPPLLGLSIQRMHHSVKHNTTKLNSQEVKFGDTLSVPSKDGNDTLKYVLIGYILFVGNTDKGHYRVVCKGEGDRWFQYNDHETECKTPYELSHHLYKRQVIFLLYAKETYYNGTMELL
jgi:ubiquitin C-terminal hydrolase